MTSNTQLGQAVRGACEELETLGALEAEVLRESEELLKKLGFKGTLFQGTGSSGEQAERDQS